MKLKIKEKHLNLYDWSDLASFLIKEAAKCEHFASDIYYDLDKIHKVINEDSECKDDFIIAFRDTGVDNKEIAEARLGTRLDKDYISNHYFALYKLTINKEKNGTYSNCYTVSLDLRKITNDIDD